MTTRDISDGARRILYDAMILSSSLRKLRESKSYKTKSAKNLDGFTEAHAVHALLQIRSMIDFLVGDCHIHKDTMLSVQFFGCSKQKIEFPERRAANKYAAHKSWDAVTKDVARVSKPEILELDSRYWMVSRNFVRSAKNTTRYSTTSTPSVTRSFSMRTLLDFENWASDRRITKRAKLVARLPQA